MEKFWTSTSLNMPLRSGFSGYPRKRKIPDKINDLLTLGFIAT